MQPDAVYDSTEPDELVHSLFDPEADLLGVAGAVVYVGVDVDIGEEEVLFTVGVGYDGDDLEYCHCQEKADQGILVFHEFEYPGIPARIIDLVSVGQPKTADKVEQIQTAVEGVECCSVYVLEIAPVPCEVVVGVGQRVHDQLNSHTRDHQDAEDGGALFHGVVVFEDEPFGAYAHADC